MNTQPKEINISCPHCGQHLAIDESMLDIELECPTCKQSFTALCPEEQTSEEPIVAGNASEEETTGTAAAEKAAVTSRAPEKAESVPSEAEVVSDAKTADDGIPEISRKALFREKARDWLHKTKVALVSGWQRVKEIFLRLPERAQGAMMTSVAFLIGIALFSGNEVAEHPKETNCDVTLAGSSDTTPTDDVRATVNNEAPKNASVALEGDALYKEAMRYYNGDGVLQNYDKAVQLLFDASSKGSKDADAELASIFWNGKANQQSDQELAVKYALKNGDRRTTDASMVLGLSYLFGYKTKDGKIAPDFQKAYEQFVAAGSHQQAVFFKGLMEYHGVGTAKSAQKAAETFYECCKGKTKALSVGDAAVCLGYLYYKGEGVAKNYEQAKAWLSWGWEHGHAPKVAVINELGQYPGGMDLLLTASKEYYAPLGGFVFQW